MPPKKKQKTDKSAKITGRCSNAKGASKSKIGSLPKAKKGKTSASKPVDSPMKTRSGKVSTVQQAAEGAEMYSTAQLQEIRRNYEATQRPNSNGDEVLLHPEDGEILDDHEDHQNSNNARPSTSSDEGSSSSSSLGTDSSSYEESDSDEASPTSTTKCHKLQSVRRKIPFNRETGQIGRVNVSPGSLEHGHDLRELGKLQELLSANPQAVNAIDSSCCKL